MVVNRTFGMRALAVGTVALALLAACSSGGGSAAATTTTTSTTSTTLATTTTTRPEDAVRQAWDDYWAMVVRLGAKPDRNDPELAQRVTEPLLSTLRDDYSTRAAEGRYVEIPPGAKYAHRLDSVRITGAATAEADGCKIDDSISKGPSGVTDDSVSTSNIVAVFVLDGAVWKAASVNFSNQTPGLSGCANQ